MEMGEIIKTLRTQKGLTQGELGELVGVKRAAICKYEKGITDNMKRTTIKKMADVFGVNPAYLIGLEDSNINNGENNGIIGCDNNNNIIFNGKPLPVLDKTILLICEGLDDFQKGEVLELATSLFKSNTHKNKKDKEE